jgi:hypothetical protein
LAVVATRDESGTFLVTGYGAGLAFVARSRFLVTEPFSTRFFAGVLFKIGLVAVALVNNVLIALELSDLARATACFECALTFGFGLETLIGDRRELAGFITFLQGFPLAGLRTRLAFSALCAMGSRLTKRRAIARFKVRNAILAVAFVKVFSLTDHIVSVFS